MPMIVALFAALALQAGPADASASAPPPSEALILDRKVAAKDDFLDFLDAAALPQVARIKLGLGVLTPAESAKFGDIARAKYAERRAALIEGLAVAYARYFDAESLRTIDAFLETPAGTSYAHRLMPEIMGGHLTSGYNLQGEIRKQTCAEFGKGCDDGSPKPLSTPAPLSTAPAQAATAASPLRSFDWTYRGAPQPGDRHWSSTDGATWTEAYPSGYTETQKVAATALVGGCHGVITTKAASPTSQTFIPDPDCPTMVLLFRFSNQPWRILGELRSISTRP